MLPLVDNWTKKVKVCPDVQMQLKFGRSGRIESRCHLHLFIGVFRSSSERLVRERNGTNLIVHKSDFARSVDSMNFLVPIEMLLQLRRWCTLQSAKWRAFVKSCHMEREMYMRVEVP